MAAGVPVVVENQRRLAGNDPPRRDRLLVQQRRRDGSVASPAWPAMRPIVERSSSKAGTPSKPNWPIPKCFGVNGKPCSMNSPTPDPHLVGVAVVLPPLRSRQFQGAAVQLPPQHGSSLIPNPSPMHVRLIREVNAPTGRGPGNGMFALQRLLRAAGPDWLHIGGRLRDGEMPWFWCWLDRPAACACAAVGMPLVIGPNMLFGNCGWPAPFPASANCATRRAAGCNSPSRSGIAIGFCRAAGRRCGRRSCSGPIRSSRGPAARCAPRYDLLIYEKSGFDPALPEQLRRRWPASVRVQYRRFRREQMIELARQSRACVYLSDNDRGPLALAEILLSGCPAVGVPRGSPWIVAGQTGFHVRPFRFRVAVPGDRAGHAVGSRRGVCGRTRTLRRAADGHTDLGRPRCGKGEQLIHRPLTTNHRPLLSHTARSECRQPLPPDCFPRADRACRAVRVCDSSGWTAASVPSTWSVPRRRRPGCEARRNRPPSSRRRAAACVSSTSATTGLVWRSNRR